MAGAATGGPLPPPPSRGPRTATMTCAGRPPDPRLRPPPSRRAIIGGRGGGGGEQSPPGSPDAPGVGGGGGSLQHAVADSPALFRKLSLEALADLLGVPREAGAASALGPPGRAAAGRRQRLNCRKRFMTWSRCSAGAGGSADSDPAAPSPRPAGRSSAGTDRGCARRSCGGMPPQGRRRGPGPAVRGGRRRAARSVRCPGAGDPSSPGARTSSAGTIISSPSRRHRRGFRSASALRLWTCNKLAASVGRRVGQTAQDVEVLEEIRAVDERGSRAGAERGSHSGLIEGRDFRTPAAREPGIAAEEQQDARQPGRRARGGGCERSPGGRRPRAAAGFGLPAQLGTEASRVNRGRLRHAVSATPSKGSR